MVIVAWRFRRWAGIAVLVVGLVAGRARAAGVSPAPAAASPRAQWRSGSILVASDELRFRAWGAALRMVEDKPLIGQGYLAYKELGEIVR